DRTVRVQPQDLPPQVHEAAGGALGVEELPSRPAVDGGITVALERIGVVPRRDVDLSFGPKGDVARHVAAGGSVRGHLEQDRLRGGIDALAAGLPADGEPGEVKLAAARA